MTTPQALAGGWYSWGTNLSGCCGVGNALNLKQTPTLMLLDVNAEIAVGDLQGMGRLSGQLYGWGSNSFGGLGLPNTYTNVPTPTLVPSFTGVAQHGIASGWAAALKNDGTLWFTGRNDHGQFGNGFQNTGSQFGFIQTTTGLPSTISRLIVHDSVTSLIDASGGLWMSGQRIYNRIPDGITGGPNNQLTFLHCTLVTMPVLDVALTGTASIALYNNGTVYVWGDIGKGRAGDGVLYAPGTRFTSPVQVPGLTGITAIAASNNTFFALKSDGTFWTWGENLEQEGGITGVSADSGDPILSPIRWSNATTFTVQWIGRFNPYGYVTLVSASDSKMYGSGYNNQGSTGMICRLAEQPSGTSTWTSIPGPTHGYPEFAPDLATGRRLDRILAMSTNATFVRWTAAPTVAPGRSMVAIIG